MITTQDKNRMKLNYVTVITGQDDDHDEISKSNWSNVIQFTRHKTFYSVLILFLVVSGIIATVIVSQSRKDEEHLVLRRGSIDKKYNSPERLGHMNIYIRKENKDGIRQRSQPFRFPVARFNRKQLPLHGPFLSFMPSIPMFVDRLTKQTIIFSPSGGAYIIPPLINFYGKMYSVAELIAYGYASLVSSGAPPVPPMNILPYFQPTPLYGPGIPRINPFTGSFSDGVRTNYHSFKIPKYESTEENDDDYDRRPTYRERNYEKPHYRMPYKHEKDSHQVCNIKFSSPVSYASGNDAETVYIYDFNNDEISDIATLYFTGNAMSILLGKDDGTFETPIWISTGNNSGPYELSAGDINQDDNLDIVITNYDANNIGIYLGDGQGNFALFKTYYTGENSAPLGITLADIDNDKDLDLLITCDKGNNVQIYLGKGNGKFSHHQTYETGDDTGPAIIVVHDFNKDHKLDFVLTHFTSNEIVIYFGKGNGDFIKKYTYQTGDGPYNPVLGDFNSDGKIDIATGNYRDNTTSIFHGQGYGKFELKYTLSTGKDSMPYSIAATDFNNDKILDLVVANSNTNTVGILLGTGDGNFKKVINIPNGDDTSPYTATVGDFNRDGLSDIVTANALTGDVRVLLNKCS